MEAVFWSSVAFIAYVYVGYPALLGVWARLVRRREASLLQGDAGTLGVTVIVAARDEAPRLPARIDNLLASDYPLHRLQIIVASDGSTDNPAAVLGPYGERVRLLELPASGKAGALNAAVREADHPIVVFADARQRFAPDTIRRLAAHFDDPDIGAVSGELILDCEQTEFCQQADLKVRLYDRPAADTGVDDRSSTDVEAGLQIGLPSSTIGDGVGAYWKYEKWVRRHESMVGSTIGVTGAVYAMRRWLWHPLPADTILDDVMAPMLVVLRGYRVTFDDQARAYDETAKDAPAELRRKTRTLAGNFQLLAREPKLLVPFLNPAWLQFVSHKVGRLLVPYALVAALVSSIALAATSPVYALAAAVQAAFYGLACYGAALERRARPLPVGATEAYREAA